MRIVQPYVDSSRGLWHCERARLGHIVWRTRPVLSSFLLGVRSKTRSQNTPLRREQTKLHDQLHRERHLFRASVTKNIRITDKLS
jgi:hypothetical protein